MPLVIDASQFVRDMKKIDVKWTGPLAKKALFSALGALKLDADRISPTVPKSRGGGTLRSNIEIDVKELKTQVNGALIWHQGYASYQHEGQRRDGTRVVKNYSEPGSGKKFASTKLEKLSNKYINIMGMVYKKDG